MPPDPAERVELWFARVMDHVERLPRESRTAQSGPVSVTHTYAPGSTHDDLVSALAPGGPVRAHLRVHSVEGPPRDLMVPAPLAVDERDARGISRALEATRWRLTWDGGAGIVRCLDRRTGEGILVTAGPPEEWELASPFRAHLHWTAAASGASLVHAAAVGGPGGMGLVVGPGGTGKSTTVAVALGAGLSTCGDDYVWVDPRTLTVDAVYGTVKESLHGTASEAPRLPAASRTLELADGAKRAHWLAEGAPGLFCRSAPIRSIIALGPDPGRLMAGAVASSMTQVAYDEALVAAALRRVAAAVPLISIPRDGRLETVREALLAGLGGLPA